MGVHAPYCITYHWISQKWNNYGSSGKILIANVHRARKQIKFNVFWRKQTGLINIPPECTSRFQLLDVVFNKPFKDTFRCLLLTEEFWLQIVLVQPCPKCQRRKIWQAKALESVVLLLQEIEVEMPIWIYWRAKRVLNVIWRRNIWVPASKLVIQLWRGPTWYLIWFDLTLFWF